MRIKHVGNVDAGLKEQFDRDGYVSGIQIHEREQTSRLREEFDALELMFGRARCEVGLSDLHLSHRFVWDLVTNTRILDYAETLIGPNVMVLASRFFCKYPAQPTGISGWVAWHQDITYWGIEPPEAITVWYAIDESEPLSGAVRVLPGSHRGGILPHGQAGEPGNMLRENQELDITTLAVDSAIELHLAPGEISVHDGCLVHGSRPNLSQKRRCGLAIRYIAPHVKPIGPRTRKEPWACFLVSGHDAFGHFGSSSPPFV